MATETLELKTPEQADSLPKEEDGVADSTKEAQVSEDAEKKDEVAKAETEDEDMDEKGEEDDGKSEEANTVKRGQSSEKEPVTPVSERPTRERKKTERYILHTPSRSSGSKAVSIEQGRGTKLKEIPNVAYKLSKRKPDDNLFLLHTILYGKKGKAQMLKKNIGQFSGFVWTEQEEEKQRARAKEKLEKCTKEKLIDFCDVLDIPINKSNLKKEELTVRVLEFLVNPKATRDILLADSEKKTRKRKKSTTANVTSGESSDVPAKRRRQAKSGKNLVQPTETEENGKADVGSEGTNNWHGEDDAAPEKENNHEKDTETEDNEAKERKSTDKKSSAKRTKKEKPASEEEKSLKGSTKSSGKSSKQVAKSTSSNKKQKVEKDDPSKEKGKKQTSKPQAKGSKDQGKTRKRGKREPTRKELHVVVSKILKEVDFNTATLSDILRTLGSHFGIDLMHRKAEVKDIITDAINEMSDDEEKEENTEDEGEKAKEGKERRG